MRAALLLICLLLPAHALAGGAPYAAMMRRLDTLAALPDPGRRDAALDALWDSLQAAGRFPFVCGDSVAFLWRGEAGTVTFCGDFDGWQPTPPRALRLGASDVWRQEEVFPADARLDYKIVRDGAWLLDPRNPRTQRGGFGDNSELRMPAYVPSPWVERRPDVPQGHVAITNLASAALGYTVAYGVYLPAGGDTLRNLPVIYVTDGQEYADPRMGSMTIVLDNLIAAGAIRPVAAVFIDPRVGGRNLRAEQYVLNPAFLAFVITELVPAVERTWPVSRDRRDRAILGTSLGGVNSAWFALQAPDVFGHAAIQSPACHVRDGAIVDLYRQAPRRDVDLFLSWGTQHDFGEDTARFRRVLADKGWTVRELEVDEGHSWGSWRAQLDDVLRQFWPGDGEAGHRP